jgi:hypothetical protein
LVAKCEAKEGVWEIVYRTVEIGRKSEMCYGIRKAF